MNENGWQADIPETLRTMTAAHYGLLIANLALNGKSAIDPSVAERIALIDAAAIELSVAKFRCQRAMGELADFGARTNSSADLAAARAGFARSRDFAAASHRPTNAALLEAVTLAQQLTKRGTEVWHAADVPLVPTIAPIVVLSGSSRSMGRQYAMQCIEIFGPFVFQTIAAKRIDGAALEVLRHWETAVREHTPEVIEMALGIADGATASGVPMTYEQALSIWTDLRPPADEPEPIGVLDAEGGGRMGAYFGALTTSAAGAIEQSDLCSGAAVWGDSSQDQRMHFSASTDHDCAWQVTIVAYPDSGNAFIYTPFSVNGSLPGVGRFGFAGHPGFNSRGMTFVHHGGGGSCLEPRDNWGYGVPRGAATMHCLRFANSAQEAIERELSFPVGNTARLLGHPGGFYADDSGGYVIEDRTPGKPVVRSATEGPGGQPLHFLFATNNLQSRELGAGFCPPADGYLYSPETGWYTNHPMAERSATKGTLVRRAWTKSSESRNRYFYRELLACHGQATLDVMEGLFRRPSRFEGRWSDAEARMHRGENIDASPGNRLNAFVAAGTPSLGVYRGAIGPIAPRSLPPHRPGHGFFFYDEVAAMWEITLAETPLEMLALAATCAENRLQVARQAQTAANAPIATAKLLDDAEREFADAQRTGTTISRDNTDSEVAQVARSLRAYTRAQVRARQVSDACSPAGGAASL
jgi:hypothetical protein